MPLTVASLPHHDGMYETMGQVAKLRLSDLNTKNGKDFLFLTGHQEYYIERPMTILGLWLLGS